MGCGIIGDDMSAEKCNICGVYGTSTYKCCANKNRTEENNIKTEIKLIDEAIQKLESKRKDLVEQLDKLFVNFKKL